MALPMLLVQLRDSTQVDVTRLGPTAMSLFICALVSAITAGLLVEAFFDGKLRVGRQERVAKTWLSGNLARFRMQASKASLPDPSRPDLVEDLFTDAGDVLSSIAALTMMDTDRLFSLRYGQLCAQIANALQVESSLPFEKRYRLIAAFAPALDARWLYDVLQNRLPNHASPYSNMVGRIDTGLANITREDQLGVARQLLLFHLERGLDDLQAQFVRDWRLVDYSTALVVAWLFVLLTYDLVAPGGVRHSFTQQGEAFLPTAALAVLMTPIARQAVARVSTALR